MRSFFFLFLFLSSNLFSAEDVTIKQGLEELKQTVLAFEKKMEPMIAYHEPLTDKQKKEKEKKEKKIFNKGLFWGGSLGLTAGFLGMRYYYNVGSFQEDALWVGEKGYIGIKGLAIIGYKSIINSFTVLKKSSWF